MKNNQNLLIALAFLAIFVPACSSARKNDNEQIKLGVNNAVKIVTQTEKSGASDSSTTTTAAAVSNEVEKVKPAPGKGNVQGTVLFNDKPAANIEVRLCENFGTIMGVSCTGKIVKTKTDADGVFVLANAEPMEYEGLTAKVFASNYYISPQEGIMTPQKFQVEPGKTIFANDIHLFKDDLKVTNPKAGSKINATNIELKWNSYPDAAYYKVNIYPEQGTIPSALHGERIEDTTYTLDQTLDNGKYRISIEAYNDNNHKLAESPDDYKFTVTGGNEPQTEN